MTSYSIICLRPKKSSDIAEYNEFRREDIVSMYNVLTIGQIVYTLGTVIQYFILKNNKDEVVLRII